MSFWARVSPGTVYRASWGFCRAKSPIGQQQYCMAIPHAGYILGRDIHLEYCAGALATATYTSDV